MILISFFIQVLIRSGNAIEWGDGDGDLAANIRLRMRKKS
jgi:hypothetical protein